jgi:hypothetical protein
VGEATVLMTGALIIVLNELRFVGQLFVISFIVFAFVPHWQPVLRHRL